jgi:PAS domain S-box-containing protein
MIVDDRALFERTPALLWLLAPDQTLTLVSDRWLHTLGYQRDTVVGQSALTWVNAGDRDAVAAALAQAGAQGESQLDCTLVKADGSPYPVTLTAAGVGETVTVPSLSVVMVDRQPQAPLAQASQQLLQAILDTMPQRVFWKDPQGRFLGCNHHFAQDLGLPNPASLVGKTNRDLGLRAELVQHYQAADDAVVASGQSQIQQERPKQYADGRQGWIRASKAPLYDADGALVGILDTYEDISTQRQTEQDLRRYQGMVEAATDGICLLDRDLRYQVINRTYAEWYGADGQPILGRTVAEVLGPSAYENRLRPLLERCLAGETVRYARWFDFPHLGQRFRSVTCAPYYDAEGTITGILTSICDLTDLKLSENRRQELMEVIESTTDFIGMADINGQITYLNPALQRYLAPAPDNSSLPQNIQQFHPPWANAVIFEQGIPAAIAQGTWRGESALLRPDGSEMPVSQTITSHRNDQGEVVMFSTILRDISPLKQMETTLRRQQHYFKALTERASEIVMLLAPDGTIRYVSPAVEGILGYGPGDMIQHGLLDWIHPDDVDSMATLLHWADTQADQRLPLIQYRSRHQDGSWRVFEATLTSLVADPVVTGIVAHCRDVSDRVQAEIAQRQLEQQFRGFFDQSAIGMTQVAPDGTYRQVNQAFCRMVGYGAEDLVGLPYTTLTDALDHPQCTAAMEQVMAGQTTAVTLEKRLVQSNGQLCWTRMVATGVYDTDDRLAFLACVYEDISDRVAAESTLRTIVQGTAAVTGEDFFIALAQHLAQALGVAYVLINELKDNHVLSTLAFWSHQQEQACFSYDLEHTPCEVTLQQGSYVCTQGIQTRFPADSDLATMGAESYVGVALVSREGTVLGEICLLDTAPIADVNHVRTILQIFAARATAELERQRAYQALQDSEARFQRLATNMPGIIYRYHTYGDGSDGFSYVSPACQDLWELDPAAICADSRSLWRQIHPEDVASMRRSIATAIAQNTLWCQEFRMVSPSGHQRWIQATARAMPQSDGSLVWDGVAVDVSDRKRAEAALRESEALNRAMVQALPDLLMRLRRDGTCLEVQYPSEFPAVQPSTAHVGRALADIIGPALAQERLWYVNRALQTGQTQVYEFQIEVNGHLNWEEARIVPMADDPETVLVLVRDIHERKQAEQEVRRLNQALALQNQQLEELVEQRTAELKTFINALPDQIFVVETTGVMPFGNAATAAAAGCDLQTFQNRRVQDLFPPDLVERYEAQNQQVFTTGQTLHVQEVMPTPQGVIHVDTYKIPLKRPNGEVYGLIGSSRDITELVQAREALSAQAAQLEATNQELESFSYSISHDLRAPLHHINGFIAALGRKIDSLDMADPTVRHYLDRIHHSSERMGLLIDGLLTLSRVGRRDLVWQPVNLNSLVQGVLDLLDLAPPPPTCHIHCQALPTVMGDRTLLQQVYVNLLENAVKFSRDRQPAVITLGINDAGHLYVQDNGVGFDMTYADKLFSPFQRLHSSTEFPGTGIGLAIVQRILHRHQGTIWVDSQADRGTTLWFTLIPNDPEASADPAEAIH